MLLYVVSSIDHSLEFFVQIVGLATLHSIGVIYADIKPANIFLDDRLNVKIGDFGLSRFSIEQRPFRAKVGYGGERVGTEGYQVPQVPLQPPTL